MTDLAVYDVPSGLPMMFKAVRVYWNCVCMLHCMATINSAAESLHQQQCNSSFEEAKRANEIQQQFSRPTPVPIYMIPVN